MIDISQIAFLLKSKRKNDVVAVERILLDNVNENKYLAIDAEDVDRNYLNEEDKKEMYKNISEMIDKLNLINTYFELQLGELKEYVKNNLK